MKMREIQRVSVTDSVVNSLKDMISAGEFLPGEKLATESMLCESFGVSRTCIREAMRVLQALGLVEIRPGKGAFVAEKPLQKPSESWYDEESAKFYDFLEVRMAIEPLSTRLAIERASDEQIARLDEIHASFLEAVQNKTLTKLIMLDELFHTEIVNITGNKLLININRQLVDANKKYRSKSLLDETVYQNGVVPHTRIVESFHAKDPQGGADEMYRHLCITKEDMEYIMRKRLEE